MDITQDEMKTRYTHAVQESNNLKQRLRNIQHDHKSALENLKKEYDSLAEEERNQYEEQLQQLRNDIASLRKVREHAATEMMEAYDIEALQSSKDWTHASIAAVMMVCLWAIEWNSFFFASLFLPPVSVFLLACMECIRGRHHSIFQLMPWNLDRIKAELYFDARDFTDRNSYAWATFKTMIAATFLCVFGYVPGILFAALLWSNFFLVRSKTWWRAIFDGNLTSSLSGEILQRIPLVNRIARNKQE